MNIQNQEIFLYVNNEHAEKEQENNTIHNIPLPKNT
jgi:hypothetical protein